MQGLLTIFYLVWLIAVLAVLVLIYWRTTRYMRKMEETILQSRALSAEAALKSAETAGKLAHLLEEHEHEHEHHA